MRFAARRAAALPECARHRRSSTQRVLQPPPCGRRRGQRHPLPHGRGAQRAARLCGRPYQAPTRGRGTASHDPRKARGFMCTQGASRGCRRGAAHLSPRASPRGLTPPRAPAPPHVDSLLTAPSAPPHVDTLLTAPAAPPHVGSPLTAPPAPPARGCRDGLPGASRKSGRQMMQKWATNETKVGNKCSESGRHFPTAP